MIKRGCQWRFCIVINLGNKSSNIDKPLRYFFDIFLARTIMACSVGFNVSNPKNNRWGGDSLCEVHSGWIFLDHNVVFIEILSFRSIYCHFLLSVIYFSSTFTKSINIQTNWKRASIFILVLHLAKFNCGMPNRLFINFLSSQCFPSKSYKFASHKFSTTIDQHFYNEFYLTQCSWSKRIPCSTINHQ